MTEAMTSLVAINEHYQQLETKVNNFYLSCVSNLSVIQSRSTALIDLTLENRELEKKTEIQHKAC